MGRRRGFLAVGVGRTLRTIAGDGGDVAAKTDFPTSMFMVQSRWKDRFMVQSRWKDRICSSMIQARWKDRLQLNVNHRSETR